MNESRSKIIFESQNICAYFSGAKTISVLAQESGIFMDQPCGGNGTCGKCAVRLQGVVPPPTPNELKTIADREINNGVRLACQCIARDGMTVLVDSPSKEAGQKILEFHGSDYEDITPTVNGNRLEDFFHAGKQGGIYGIALDIGTTTIAASLLDLEKGLALASASSINPQHKHGSDVISRISFLTENEDGLKILQGEIIDAVNGLIKKLSGESAVLAERIFHVVMAGNPTMGHLFAGVDPKPIGRAPFRPPFYKMPRGFARDLSLRINPSAFVDIVPNISGHVGGDIVAGIYYSGMNRSEKLSLLIDVGTNNEMALGNKDFILACSAAAGPALEGAKIKHGMRAASGAIEKAKLREHGIELSTIDNQPAIGICGSGLIDLVAEMLSAGMITNNGRLADGAAMQGNDLAKRLVKTDEGREFRLLEKQDRSWIAIHQRDVREMQLVKAAIATGVEMMLEKASLQLKDIEQVFLAGAFGSYMDKKNAVSVGILPDVPLERIIPIGNGAGLGCIKALFFDKAWNEFDNILEIAEHLELAASAEFHDRFFGNIDFK